MCCLDDMDSHSSALKAWSAKQQCCDYTPSLWLRFSITILKNINTSNVASLTNFYRKLVYSEHHIKHHSCLFRSIKWTHYWVISQCTTLNARLIITGLAVAAKNQIYDYIYTFHFSFHRWVCLWVQWNNVLHNLIATTLRCSLGMRLLVCQLNLQLYVSICS